MLDEVDGQQYSSQSSIATDGVPITDDEEIGIRQLDNNKETSCNKKNKICSLHHWLLL